MSGSDVYFGITDLTIFKAVNFIITTDLVIILHYIGAQDWMHM